MMSTKPTFATIGCLIILLVGTQSVLAVDPAGRLRLGASGGVAVSEQEDLNGIMDDLEDFWSDWDIALGNIELRSALLGGAYAEYLINQNWVVGAEFMRLSSSSGYDWFVDSGGITDVDVSCGATGNLVSVYGAYRFPLGDSAVALRLGAGAGYLFGASTEMDFGVYQEERAGPGPGNGTLRWLADLKASGSTAAFHGLAGAEYELGGNLLLSANLTYRVAAVTELKVDDVSASVNGEPDESWDIEEGDVLRWYNGEMGTYFSTVEGDRVGLDFTGLHVTVSVAYVF